MRTNLEQANLWGNVWQTGRVGLSRKVLAGNYLIVDGTTIAHFLDPDGGTRNVILPENAHGMTFFIFNVGGAGTLSIRTNLLVELTTVEAGGGIGLVSSASEWGFLSGAGGSVGVSYPTVRRAAGTITFDPDTDDHILAEAGVATINLPPSGDRTEGREVLIVDRGLDADTNTKTIVPDGAELISGLSSVTITNRGGAVRLFPDPDGGWYGQIF